MNWQRLSGTCRYQFAVKQRYWARNVARNVTSQRAVTDWSHI